MTSAKMTPAALAISDVAGLDQSAAEPRTKPAAVAPMPSFSAPSAPG